MEAEEYYNKIRRQLGTQALLSYQIDGCRLYGKDAICKMLEDYHQAKLNLLTIPVVSVSLPSVDDAGIIAVEISEINNEMTAQEQAFFIAGFSECIKYLEMQSNER